MTYNNIKEVTFPQSKDSDIGKRWKWRKDIPDDALWPQCGFCGKFLKIEPVALISNNVIKDKPEIEIFAVRRCKFCDSLDTRKYWWEDKVEMPKMR